MDFFIYKVLFTSLFLIHWITQLIGLRAELGSLILTVGFYHL